MITKNTNAGAADSTAPPARKRSILINILIGLAVLVVLLLVVIAMQPSDFHVSRSTTIAAPPEPIFAEVNDFHNWQAWSPYDKLDPEMKRTYEGPPEGVGAVYRWNGNNQVGEGSSTITESRPNELIKIDLEFLRPFAGKSVAEFTFKPQEEQTTVTWSLSGKNDFMAKAVGFVMNMDKMIGGQFEEGLANLKSVVESANKQ